MEVKRYDKYKYNGIYPNDCIDEVEKPNYI
jgi:hypothetical protein